MAEFAGSGNRTGLAPDIRDRRATPSQPNRQESCDAHYRAMQNRANRKVPSDKKGTFALELSYRGAAVREVSIMDGIIYLVGLIVIIMAILSFFGLR